MLLTRILQILLSPFIFLGRGVTKILRIPSVIIFSKGRTRIRLVLILILLTVFFAGNLDYPKYWDNTADWVNPKIEKLDVPASVEKYDKWQVFATIDDKSRLPHFWERDYSLGLDLQGGIHLVYEADLSSVRRADQAESMDALRDMIERRVNILGVSEPVVQVQRGDDSSRLIIELAGISDPNTAIAAIGETPFLDFKEPRQLSEQVSMAQAMFEGIDEAGVVDFCSLANPQMFFTFLQAYGKDPCFVSTGLTGQYLDSASVNTHAQTGALQIGLQFNAEGATLFEEVTSRNIGNIIAIYLDELPVSLPRVNDSIAGGQAVISGSFSADEARSLVRNLNAGALPVPISLLSQQRVGASLGSESLQMSLSAAFVALLAVITFLIIVYRFSGLLAVLSLGMYLIFLLALIKLIPITLTLAGIAGLILSIGMAVDANVLVFERLREELEASKGNLTRSIDNAFARAWPSIRDGNISTLLTAAILFWFSTSFVKGFALTLGIGILVSMFSAMIITKHLMKLFAGWKLDKFNFIWTR